MPITPPVEEEEIVNGQVYIDPNIYQETDAGIVGTQLAKIPVGSPPTTLLAQGGIVSLAGGGTPKGVGITPDFMIDYYNNSLIPRALDGDKVARDHLLEAHKNFSNFTLPEELLLKVKYGRANGGVASLSDTARNMFRPMVG